MEFTITLCVSSRIHGVKDIVNYIKVAPTRVSEATEDRDDCRVFWDLECSEGELFEEINSRAVAWAVRCAGLLLPIDDAALTLWYVVQSNSEFAGLAFQSEQLRDLGECKVDLVISVYTQPEQAV